MPYITQSRRRELAPILNPILDIIQACSKGDINYIITRIVAKKYAKHVYEERSEGASVLQDAHDEYYRRVVAPYEDIKREENGDVF